LEEDLINFNQNKTAKIEELIEKLPEINHQQSLQILWSNSLLTPSVLKQINKTLLYILFSSVDYKIPEKKPVPVPETKPEENNEQQEPKSPEEGEENPAENTESPQGDEPKDVPEKEEEPKETPEKENEQKVEQENVAPVIQEPEEEFKFPEITPFEQTLVELSKRIKINFVKDWERKECDAIVRFRNPLQRNPPEENKPEEEEEVEKISTARSRKKEEKNIPVPVQEPEVVEEQPQESFNEKMKRLIVNDEFIEPYDGSTFEKEQLEFPGNIK